MVVTAPLLPLLVLLTLQWSAEVQSLTHYECEGNHLYFMCQGATPSVIFIQSAVYGRKQRVGYRCGEDVVLRKRCEVDITQFMKYQCEGHPVCEVMVDVATFNAEFCPDVKKYAEVVFECVPVDTLDRVRRCNDKCLSLATPPHPFGSKYAQPQAPLKTQIRQPGKAIAPPGPKPAAVPAPPARPPAFRSPPSSTKTAHRTPAPVYRPPVPSLPYGNLNRSFSAALRSSRARASGGTGSAKQSFGPAQSSTPMSAAMRASLLQRMQRMLIALRNRKAAG